MQDSGLGVCPKSMLHLGNGDIILGTFSSKKGYTFKAFTSEPFTRIPRVKSMSQVIDKSPFCPYYEAMTFQSHFYKFHALDDNSFYRFDSKQFYIVRKHPDYSNE